MIQVHSKQIDGVDRWVTECRQCQFFSSGTCQFGRLEKYRERGEADGNSVLTLCNYARDNGQSKEEVIADNRLRYDFVMRIKSLDEIKLDFPKDWSPLKVIISYSNIPTKDIIEKQVELNDPRVIFVEIFNQDKIEELELLECTSQFVAYCTTDKLSEIFEELDFSVNISLNKTVLYIDGTNYVYMRQFALWAVQQNLTPTLDNFKLLTNERTSIVKSLLPDSQL